MFAELNLIRVVLVDDDAEDREFFGEVIEELPFNVALTLYKNGQEFVDGMVSGGSPVPDLVFLDLNMPIKNGKDALKELRAMEEFKTIPVIAIYSTSTSEADQADTFLAGADAFISKPTDYRDLKHLIAKIFEIDWKGRSGDRKNFVITPL